MSEGRGQDYARMSSRRIALSEGNRGGWEEGEEPTEGMLRKPGAAVNLKLRPIGTPQKG